MRKPLHEPLGEIPRFDPEGLATDQRNIGSEVPMARVASPFDLDRRRLGTIRARIAVELVDNDHKGLLEEAAEGVF